MVGPVSARFCARCGTALPTGSGFCPSCGAAVAGAAPPPASPGAPPPPAPWGAPAYSPYPPAAAPPPTPTYSSEDLQALSNVQWAVIVGLVGAVLGLVNLLGTRSFGVIGVTTSPGGTTSFTLDYGVLATIVATAAAALVLVVIELMLYRSAFQTLSRSDPRFSTPSTLVLMAVISLVAIMAIGGGLAALLFQAIACAGSGNAITSACINVWTALGLIVALALVGIIAFVGFIGLLIGIWRLGTRYNEGLFHASAILLIFPVLNLIGLILMLVAVHNLRQRLGTTPLPGSFA